MSGNVREIEVCADWAGLGGPERLGTLFAQQARGREVFSFEYARSWLLGNEPRLLDPELRLFGGPQYAAREKPNFGLFLDSSPDRWGRMLMQRRESIRARKGNRIPRALSESDYLLGVYDENRMGALRFRESGDAEFQSADQSMTAPPWTSLRDLEYASYLVEHEENDENLDKWLALLMAPGSSLGGARPKASVLFPDGSLWMAKFPGKDDDRNIGAWEMLTARLACEAGIEMSDCRLEAVSHRGSTFLTRRFDRSPKRERVHFASAMTMLGRSDGADATIGASYLEIADFLIRHGSQPQKDLRQLWKRILFNIAVSNTDDHLRNHGFLLESQGWRLSPAYDMNPSPFAGGLSLAIDESDNSLDFELALSVAEYFRLSLGEAREAMSEVLVAVSRWRKSAEDLGIPQSERDRMAQAFRTAP
ncbi:MAG: HipA domain-containing protein [Rectinema sp.]